MVDQTRVDNVVDSSGTAVGQQPSAQRNLAFSDVSILQLPVAHWSTWTIRKAVNDGMKSNNWVYRCVRLIVSTFTQLPFRIYDEDGTVVQVPVVDDLLENPNPEFSRQDTFEMLAAWLLLAGRAYMYHVDGYLWPVSPDRLSPVRSKALNQVLLGYAAVRNDGSISLNVEYPPEQIIALVLLNPADPVDGLSPLFAAAKHVDLDNEQADFNKSAMQNRGELAGFISFKEDLTPEQVEAYYERINARYGSPDAARKIGVLGAGAAYNRIGSTPVEMDFAASATTNRDRILSTFGVPPQLVGAQEASTYDNMRTAELLLWSNAVLPLADDVCDTLTHWFGQRGMLKRGQRIRPDTSVIPVLQGQLENKVRASEGLYRMGVPVQQINRVLSLGIADFTNWDQSYNGAPATVPALASTPTSTNARHKLREFRNIAHELRTADQEAHKMATTYAALLSQQADAVFTAIDGGESETQVVRIATAFTPQWTALVHTDYMAQALTGMESVVIAKRAKPDVDAIDAYLAAEGVVLKEVARIQGTTVDNILLQLRDGLEQGLGAIEIKQAITDAGIFDPARALRIARTVTGTAQSIGQLSGAVDAGASVKIWQTASDSVVRELHGIRNGEEAPLDGVFTRQASSNGVYPRYPLDPAMAADDRINCRCSLTFRA